MSMLLQPNVFPIATDKHGIQTIDAMRSQNIQMAAPYQKEVSNIVPMSLEDHSGESLYQPIYKEKPPDLQTQQQRPQQQHQPAGAHRNDKIRRPEEEPEPIIQDKRKWGGMELRLANVFNGRGKLVKFTQKHDVLKTIKEKDTDAWLLQQCPPEISDSELIERFNVWQKRLIDDMEVDNDPDVYKRIRGFFGVKDDSTDITNTIEVDFRDCSAALESLHSMMVARGLAKADTSFVVQRQRHEVLDAMRENLATSYQVHIGVSRIRNMSNPTKRAFNPAPQPFTEKLTNKGYDDFHRLFVFLLKQFAKKNYRRTGGDVYVQQLNSKKQFATCWKRECTIREAIYKCIEPRYMYIEAWRCAFKSGGRNITNAAQQLQESESPEFKRIYKNRKRLAFDDYIYFVDEDAVLEHGHPDIPPGLTCAKFFHCKFDNNLYEQQMGDTDDWRKIETPAAEAIMDSQKFDSAVKAWMYILMGRMFHDVNTQDQWQIQKFLKGIAGTGKSTLLRNQEYTYDACDLGIMSNTIEKNFPLEALLDCFIYLALDISNDFNLDQTLWQSMVSGEEVAVNRKNKLRITVQWVHPGAMAGNNMPPWKDNAGSVSRRIVHFDFAIVVSGGNPYLPELLKKQFAPWIKKISLAYNDVGHRVRFYPIHELLPHYFKKTRRKIQTASHPLENFMESQVLDFGEGLYVPMTIFQDEFFKYCRTHNLLMPRGMNEDYYNSIFQGRNIKVVDDTRIYEGDTMEGKFLVNIDVKAAVRQNNNNNHHSGGARGGGGGWPARAPAPARTSPVPGAQNAAH